MNVKSKQLRAEGQFSLKLALNYLRHSNSAVLEKVDEDGYSRVFIFEGHPFLVNMTDSGDTVHIHVHGESVTESVVSRAEEKIRSIFSMDKDPLPFQKMASLDPILHSVTHIGLRPVLLGDPFEALVWSIIGQQVNTTFAKKLKQNLIELCKCYVEVNGECYGYLPSAKQIVELDPSELRENHFSFQKITYLQSTAEAIIANQLNFDELTHMSRDDAMRYLCRFRGIGNWTAECILMRGIGSDDIFPAADVGLQTITAAYYGAGKKMKEEDLRNLSKQWKPWRSWAAFLWWNCLQNDIASKANDK